MTFLKSLASSKPTFDSANVSIRVSLAQKITKEGAYFCSVLNTGGQSRTFKITVRLAGGGGQSMVDCDELFARDDSNHDIEVGVEDYLLFVSTEGKGEYGIVITQADGSQQVKFDSKSVGIDGLIILNPMLPGSYKLTNTYTGVTVSMTVTPLDSLFDNPMSDEAVKFYENLRDEGALQVSLSNTAFSPDPIKLVADRPMVVMGSGPMRIQCELIEALHLSRNYA